MVLAEPSLLIPEIAETWNVPDQREYGPLLIVGTEHGSVLVCDVQKGGEVVRLATRLVMSGRHPTG